MAATQSEDEIPARSVYVRPTLTEHGTFAECTQGSEKFSSEDDGQNGPRWESSE